ncbi:MAG: hypothetical protein AB7L92_09265 [Alphaproteobacteria bacterium]
MPSHWIYFIALVLILVLRISVVDTSWLAEWMWYRGQEQAYYSIIALQTNETFLEYIGGWPLPVFVITVFMYWLADDNGKVIDKQFLLLPFVYLPFSIIGSMLAAREFMPEKLLIHPLVVLPSGYLYILPWVLFVWVFIKLKLVVTE